MRLSEIKFDAPARILRQFAVLWLVVLGGLGLGKLYSGDSFSGAVLLTVALAVGLTGIARPRVIRHVFGAAMIVAFPIGWVVSNILLALIYYGVFTPMALAFRLIGRDALRRRKTPHAESYWETRPQATSASRYFQQF